MYPKNKLISEALALNVTVLVVQQEGTVLLHKISVVVAILGL